MKKVEFYKADVLCFCLSHAYFIQSSCKSWYGKSSLVYESAFWFHQCSIFRCGLPVCNEACEKGHLHGNYECAIFAQAFDREGKDQKRKMPTIENMYAPCPLYTCITPLRLLLRQQRAKESNEQVGFLRFRKMAWSTLLNSN